MAEDDSVKIVDTVRKLGMNKKGLILRWGSNQYVMIWPHRSKSWDALIRATWCLGKGICRTRSCTLFSSLSLVGFCIQTPLRQIIFTVVPITFHSIKQKCKTNIRSSALYSSTFPSWEGLLCNVLCSLWLWTSSPEKHDHTLTGTHTHTLTSAHTHRYIHTHTHTEASILYCHQDVGPQSWSIRILTAHVRKRHLSLTYN